MNTNIECDSALSCPWYALYTKHQHEKNVANILSCKGFVTFLPLFESARRWHDRTKVLALPLFPSYVFIRGDVQRRLEIVTTPGVHFVVSCGLEPAPISESEIESIQRAIRGGFVVTPHPFLKTGDRVKVKRGPLAGVHGYLVRAKKGYRLVLCVDMLGKAAAVEVDSCSVERVYGNPN